ncbi:MAG: flagellar assembly protein FliW [Lachnospiraceae bacterium]|nr:flagellar assembly protein FliW [Lachnospiraceae bacterium]
MKVDTRVFGSVEIDEQKIIRFPGGIVGFPELTEFALVHDEEQGNATPIRWLQSLQEPGFAMPVMDPLRIVPDYNPQVEDELLKPLGEFPPEEMLVLVTVTVPSDLTKMSVNLQAPLVINAATRKAAQLIVETEKYPVKYYIYDILQSRKKEGE